MAFHYNTAILKNLSDFWRLKGDALPSDLDETIIPVFDVMPPPNILRIATATNTGAAQTIYAVPSDQDFYLHTVALYVIKDVTATSTGSEVKVTIDGSTRALLSIPGITLTVQQAGLTLSFPTPLKIDRGTNITVENSAATANVTARATITGSLI